MKMSKSEALRLMELAIARDRDFVASHLTDENPQVIVMRLRAESRLEALVDVRDALTGRDSFGLRLMAKEPR